MAIEKRNDGRQQYFYRKKRVGKKVVSEYVGGREFDFLLADWEENDRMLSWHERNMRDAERYDLEKIDQKLDDLEADINEIVSAHLSASGFYRTSSREWRYKQNG